MPGHVRADRGVRDPGELPGRSGGSHRDAARGGGGAMGVRVAAGLALVVSVLSLPAGAGAQQGVDREIVESERRLEQIRREGADLREEMTRLRSQVSGLSSEVSNLDLQLGAATGALGELEFQLLQREQQIERNRAELQRTRELHAARRAILNRRLRAIYKRGPMPTVQVLLAAESFGDLLNRYRYLYLIARHDRQLAEEVADLERRLVAQERALRVSLAQLETVRDERARENEQLAALRAHQRRALNEARSEEAITVQRIAQLERDESRLGELLGDLERQRREQELAAVDLRGPSGVAGPAVATLRPGSAGTLDWPLEGRLLYGFGRVVQPDGRAVRWSGIGIAAPAGSPVRAVEGGTAVLAGPFEGYGPTVVVSHGAGYYTVYLYLNEIRVRPGEPVRRGAAIGTVGEPPAGEGPHIEFQLRGPGGQALDPLLWLRRR